MLSEWARYDTNCEVLGGAGFGKTTFAVRCNRKHIRAGSVCWTLDYKSGLYESCVAFIAAAHPAYRAVYLNLSNPDRIQHYDPFALPKGRDLSTHAASVSEVVLRLVSGQRTEDLQNYAWASEPFFAYVAESHEPVYKALRLFEDPKAWLIASERLPEKYAWMMRDIARTPAKEWDYKVGTLGRRLRPFVTATAIVRMIAKPGFTIRDLFQSRTGLFVNATPSGVLPRNIAKLALGLLLSDITLTGIEESTNPKTTFLYCDETQEWAPPDLGSLLDLCRAARIRATIIHHHQGQLDPRSQESLDVNAGIKVIFGGLKADRRRKIAEDAYVMELIQRHHKQERYSTLTEYETEDSVSITERDDGTSSTTTSERLIPHQEQVVTGYDDYSRDEVLDRLAARFVLPKRVYQAILPDQTIQAKVPTLAPYLYNSEISVEFRKAQPGISPDEADRNNFERSKPRVSPKRKNSARLFDAE